MDRSDPNEGHAVSSDDAGPVSGAGPHRTQPAILQLAEHPSGVIVVARELDALTGPILEERLAPHHGSMRLNLGAVSFIDSAGVAALSRLSQRCEADGCALRIEACSPQVERELHSLGLYERFTQSGHGHPESAAP